MSVIWIVAVERIAACDLMTPAGFLADFGRFDTPVDKEFAHRLIIVSIDNDLLDACSIIEIYIVRKQRPHALENISTYPFALKFFPCDFSIQEFFHRVGGDRGN